MNLSFKVFFPHSLSIEKASLKDCYDHRVIHEPLLLVREVQLENDLTVAGTRSDIWKVATFFLGLSQGSSTSTRINFPSGS